MARVKQWVEVEHDVCDRCGRDFSDDLYPGGEGLCSGCLTRKQCAAHGHAITFGREAPIVNVTADVEAWCENCDARLVLSVTIASEAWPE